MGTWLALRRSGPHERVKIRDFTGDAELAVADTSAASAIACLDHVIEGEIAAADLAVCDRDRALALIYEELYGGHIDTTVTCASCAKLFDLDFDLAPLVALCEPTPPDQASPEIDGVPVRAPTGRDELALEGLPVAEASEGLLRRVTGGETPAAHRSKVADFLETFAPMVSVGVAATCPECGDSQTITFDMQNYLLRKIVLDRPALIREVHALAQAYHWSRADILALPMTERRRYARLVERAPAATARSRL